MIAERLAAVVCRSIGGIPVKEEDRMLKSKVICTGGMVIAMLVGAAETELEAFRPSAVPLIVPDGRKV